MPVVALSFNKMLIEKHGPVKGKVKVNNNVALKDIEKTEIPVGSTKQSVLKFHFEFTAKYEPKLADMLMTGYLTYFETPDAMNKIVDEWKKNKSLSKDIMSSVLNTVLSRCNVEAMLFAREMNLPPPIPMPKVNIG